MTPTEKIRDVFDKLAQRKPPSLFSGSALSVLGSAWLIEALAQIEATFGEAHEATRSMRGSLDYLRTHAPYGKDVHTYVGQGNAVEGAFHAAKQIVDSDTINGLIDIVLAETEADLLGQADTLLDAKAVAAAAVIAGGALETYLSSLIGRFAIPLQQHGDRGISTYNNAVASYRKKNPNLPLYSAATGDQISGWAKMRNDAAHDPLKFSKDYSAERVRQMIDGIRSLIGGKS